MFKSKIEYFFTRSVQINVLFMDLHILAKKATFFINNVVNVTSLGQVEPMCLSLNESGRETVQITHK